MLGWMNGMIANLYLALWMWADPLPKVAGKHLSAKANAKKWLLLLERNPDPIYLAPQPGIFIIGAHGPAKNHGANMLIQRFRERITKPRPPHIERIALRQQKTTESAGG
jgi:hypothetical protein